MIIAEIGHNHNADIALACEMIRAAANVGVDVVKFQLYETDYIKQPHETNYKELKESELSKYDLCTLYRVAEDNNIEFLVSIFDEDRFDWIKNLGLELKRHKIASRVIYNMSVINKMINSGLPIIASLGAWNEKGLPHYLPRNTDFLECQTRRSILQKGYSGILRQGTTGISDHTIGTEAAKKAIRGGAKIIEKHFTFNKNWKGWDQPASATPSEFKELVDLYGRINGRSS